MRSCVGCPSYRAIGFSESHHEVAVVKRIGNESASFVSHHSFSTAHLMKERGHFFEIRRAAVVYYIDAAEIGAFALCGLSNSCFVSQQSNTSHPSTRANRGRNNRAGIVSFGQYNMLRLSGGALANSFEYGHGSDLRLDTGGTFSVCGV